MQIQKASKLGITTELLTPAILEVIDRLMGAGYDAFIVGGSVRDSLIGIRPKDFDAVTNATPEQIKKVFGRQCRIIGRRFELAHVYCGRDMIEVATFRAPSKQATTNADGMVLRDNTWGTIEEDFSRRDFTVNALYYQPRKDAIHDFCGGLADVKRRNLTILGDPKKRFIEDPVRILRAIRFAAKLNFNLDSTVQEQVSDNNNLKLLQQVSPHRLYDESSKMFTSGAIGALLELLVKHHVWTSIFPFIPAKVTPLIRLAAENTDRRMRLGKTINPAFFWAVLLWGNFEAHLKTQLKTASYSDAVMHAGRLTLQQAQKHIAIPRFAESIVREIWSLQARLIQPKARQIPALALHPRFRAAYDFLVLREQAGDPLTEQMGQWWTDYQQLDNDSREMAIKVLSRNQLRKNKSKTAATVNADVIEGVIVAGTDQLTITNIEITEPDSLPNLDDDDDLWLETAPLRSANGRNKVVVKRTRRPRDLSNVWMGPYE